MEFRCRLGTAAGEIVEGVYIADSEARLRRELEEKGMYVLSLQRRAALSLSRVGAVRRIKRQEFLVFNQELATLLKAGMPLVQSLDILRQRVLNPTFKTVLDSVHDRVRSGTSLSDAFGEHGSLFPASVLGVAAGRRAQRQPRCGHPALRRLREDRGRGKAPDAVGTDLSGAFW